MGCAQKLPSLKSKSGEWQQTWCQVIQAMNALGMQGQTPPQCASVQATQMATPVPVGQMQNASQVPPVAPAPAPAPAQVAPEHAFPVQDSSGANAPSGSTDSQGSSASAQATPQS